MNTMPNYNNMYAPTNNAPCIAPQCVQNPMMSAPNYNQPMQNMGMPVQSNPSTSMIPMPSNPSAMPLPSNPSMMPIMPDNQPMPVTAESMQYLNGFIRTQIGRKVTVDFLIGANTLVDKTGTLVAVGANYLLINETETDDLLACDFYNLKFIKFYY